MQRSSKSRFRLAMSGAKGSRIRRIQDRFSFSKQVLPPRPAKVRARFFAVSFLTCQSSLILGYIKTKNYVNTEGEFNKKED